jgi:glycosyltransferase involved in cell wall biosynthesis
MAMATVDVLVPTYNRAAMLRQCLESIQTQSYRDIRVIIGDNCSDDDTMTVAQDFCNRDSRFSYVRNATNLGMYGNMNALFTRATAPYTHFMHDDDWLEPSFYEKMIAGLEASPEVALAWPRVILSQRDNETLWRLPDRFDHDQVVPAETAFEELLRSSFIHPSAVVFRASALREVGLWRDKYLTADWLMWLRMANRHALRFVDVPLVHYRLHLGQASVDGVRMGEDAVDMLNFAIGLEEFADKRDQIAAALVKTACNYIIREKDSPQAFRQISRLSTYCLGHVPSHHGAIWGSEVISLAYAAMPSWLRPRKGSGLRHLCSNLLRSRSVR